MSYKTILLILLFINFQNNSWSQPKADFGLEKLQEDVSNIVEHAILHQAFPGCVVYASRAGQPFYYETFGFHTYDSLQPVLNSDLYDLASLTKVTAATLALMKLYEDGFYDLDDPINKYVKGLGNSEVGKGTLRQILAHQAGFESWIKYYERIKRKNGNYKSKTLSMSQSIEYPYQVSENLYVHRDFEAKIKRYIKKTDVDETKGYLYSGLFFYLVPEMVFNLTGLDFETYLKENFYLPLNLESICFNPYNRVGIERIVPTELDTFFRMKQIHGYVHDEGAILMKGVSGNAGLFSNASDLAKIGEMLLSNGRYDSIQLLKPSTISLFTTYQYPNKNNRRGLGFDKPLLEYDSLKSTVAKSASFRSYGHTGFTGTLIWVDPEYDLVYVFLSNRVFPSRDNKSIYELKVRPEIHQLFYDYIDSSN